MNTLLTDSYSQIVGNCLLPFYEGRLRRRGTFQYRREFEQNQWKSADEITGLQWRKLCDLLKHAYGTVDYYRRLFDDLEMRPKDIHTPSDFACLPILDKAAVRDSGASLLSKDFDVKDLVRSATGGSTGEPMQFYYNRDSFDRRVAAAMRGDGWAGWKLCAGEFYIWGAPLLPQNRLKRYKTHLHHVLLRRSIVNSFQFGSDYLAQGVQRYQRARPRVVVAFANPAYEFARYVKKANIKIHAPVGVITSAEKLYPYQRTLIEEVFQAPVYDRYGCREVMMIGAECERHEGLHVTSDNVYVEIVSNGHACGPGETGEILLTDLHNYGMPLIRYKVGDLGSWKGVSCSCGRGLPLMNVVEGRVLDVIVTPDGRAISGEFFPHLMKDFAAIRTFQVIQEQKDLLNVRLALAEPLPSSQLAFIKSTIDHTIGPAMRIEWEIGEDVVIEPTRKFRPVMSRVSLDGGAPVCSEQ